MRALAIVAVLCGTARADVEEARDDLVEMRHGRMPFRVRVLGWMDDGGYAVRRTDCHIQDDSGLPQCEITIVVARPAGTTTHALFSTSWDPDCGLSEVTSRPAPATCWAISGAEASKLLATERSLRARLGSFTPGTPVAPPFDVAGGRITVAGYDTANQRRAAIVLASGGKWRPLRVIWKVDSGRDEFMRRYGVERVERSPDGKWLAVSADLHHAEDDYYWETFPTVVVPMP